MKTFEEGNELNSAIYVIIPRSTPVTGLSLPLFTISPATHLIVLLIFPGVLIGLDP